MNNDTTQISTPVNVNDLISKAKEIYNGLKQELEEKFKSKYVAIEVSSGKYFIGDTRDEAIAQAKKEFPDQLMFVRRIGELDKVARSSYSYPLNSYARIL